MDFSLAPSLDGWSALGCVTELQSERQSFDFASIPDPLRLRHEGIAIQQNEDAPENVLSDWCKRANECLHFLAATDPSRIWIWQEQLLPILLALSATLAAGRAAQPAGGTLTAQAGAARCPRRSRQRLKHQPRRAKRDGQSDRTPPYRRGSRSPSARGRHRPSVPARRADVG